MRLELLGGIAEFDHVANVHPVLAAICIDDLLKRGGAPRLSRRLELLDGYRGLKLARGEDNNCLGVLATHSPTLTHDAYVLLRHRLLLRGRRLEGFVLCRTVAPPDALAFAPPEQFQNGSTSGVALPALCPQPRTCASVTSPRSRSLLDLDCVVGKGTGKLSHQRRSPLMALVRALHGHQAGFHLDLLIGKRQKGVPVTPVEGIGKCQRRFSFPTSPAQYLARDRGRGSRRLLAKRSSVSRPHIWIRRSTVAETAPMSAFPPCESTA